MFCLMCIFAAPGAARAQAAGGSISGTVTREAGGTMPGVRVSLADQARTVAREVTTDMDGFYNLPAVPPAAYELTISAPGFVTQMWSAIIVGVGTERVLNIGVGEACLAAQRFYDARKTRGEVVEHR